MNAVSSSDRRTLEARATQFLRRNGYTSVGTSVKKASGGQIAFEKRLICTAPPGSGKRR